MYIILYIVWYVLSYILCRLVVYNSDLKWTKKDRVFALLYCVFPPSGIFMFVLLIFLLISDQATDEKASW